MKIAVVSTSKGSGATFIATNFAHSCSINYIDLNLPAFGSTLFKGEKIDTLKAVWHTENLTESHCGNCDKCANACAKKCYLKTEEDISLFCKGCPSGKCTLSCEKQLLNGKEEQIGEIFVEKYEKIKVLSLNTREENLSAASECAVDYLQGENAILDMPESTTPQFITALKLCDYCVIVTEGSSFDFEQFKAIIRLCKLTAKPYGVIINKLLTHYDKLTDYCNLHSTDVLAKIPYNKRDERIILSGEIISKVKFSYKQYFTSALQVIKKKIK